MRKLKKKYKNAIKIISAIGCVALILTLVIIQYNKSNQYQEFESLEVDNLPRHNYNFDLLKENQQGYLTYRDNNGT